MAAFWSFLRSTIGLKVQMAVSGFILFGFCVEHLVGMMLFFKGPGTINGYGSLLRYSPAALWTARSVMLIGRDHPYLDRDSPGFAPVGRAAGRLPEEASRTHSPTPPHDEILRAARAGVRLLSPCPLHLGPERDPRGFRRGRCLRQHRKQLSVSDGWCWCTCWERAWSGCICCTAGTACSSRSVCGIHVSMD
jgi:hypothetical protein